MIPLLSTLTRAWGEGGEGARITVLSGRLGLLPQVLQAQALRPFLEERAHLLVRIVRLPKRILQAWMDDRARRDLGLE